MRKFRKDKGGSAGIAAVIVFALVLVAGAYYVAVYEPSIKGQTGTGGTSGNNNNGGSTNNGGATNNSNNGGSTTPAITINSVGVKYMSDTSSGSSHLAYLVPVARVSEGGGDYLLTSFTDSKGSSPVLISNTFATGGAMNMRLVLGITGPNGQTFTNTTTFSMLDVVNAPSSVLTVHFGSVGYSREGNYYADLTLQYLNGGTWHTINALSS